jgi:aspartate/methionine/tyrosine aminotransferase
MGIIERKFERLSTENAPGQEARQSVVLNDGDLRGEPLQGVPVDFSHGDVNQSAFEPTPGARDEFLEGQLRGTSQAYTEYRGESALREQLADRLGRFTGRPISSEQELIITPGTQGALFLAVATTVAAGDKVALVRPDYFANRKIIEFMDGEPVPVSLDYNMDDGPARLNLSELRAAFEAGAKTFLFSNPNNPTGVVYSADVIASIARLAAEFGATVIVDQLYSRLLYNDETYTHLRADPCSINNVLTIMGPSKTESLSGYRLGVAFGPSYLIERMEKLQAVVSLRAAGYSQSVLRTWFAEPDGWLQDRINKHQAIRDQLIQLLRGVDGLFVRSPQAGSYLFPRLPSLSVSMQRFVQILRQQGGITVTPGTEFSPHTGDSIRLNFSQNHINAVAAIKRLAQLVDRYRA